jgi:hypothetical protein
MFSDDPRDLARSLSEMHRTARDKCLGNQVEARGIVRQWIQNDRRFDAFDADRLASRVEEAMSCGRSLDLADDPYLLRGGSKRPLSF